jgi:FtsP/CotA-like multicopper oxidase with cupredoxin domain
MHKSRRQFLKAAGAAGIGLLTPMGLIGIVTADESASRFKNPLKLPPPHANELGLKDTVLINSGERVRVITQFENYADASSPYMFHCHILEHEDAGMMGQFVVVT